MISVKEAYKIAKDRSNMKLSEKYMYCENFLDQGPIYIFLVKQKPSYLAHLNKSKGRDLGGVIRVGVMADTGKYVGGIASGLYPWVNRNSTLKTLTKD